MSGERDLASLQRSLAPRMHDGVFVYCTVPDGEMPAGLAPVCSFREDEGLSLIVEKAQAVALGLPHVFEARLITLTVHSSLEAVGLMASLATRFAEAGIPCNVVSAYHHDHFFVPIHQASQAMELLGSNIPSTAVAESHPAP